MSLIEAGLSYPIIEAPMAGVSTPERAAAVSNAAGLGSIAVGATDADGARAMIAQLRMRTDRPFNVNAGRDGWRLTTNSALSVPVRNGRAE